jgi:hypothetical protein
MKVYIILNWFWEGDSYLVNSYEDCFSELKSALEHAENLAAERKNKIYGVGHEIPKEQDGGYGSPSFYQIIEKEL